MNAPPVKLHWLDEAIRVYNFHVQQLIDEKGWTQEKTAEVLNRSTGSISCSIKLAMWSRTHDKQLRRCRSVRSALDFIATIEKQRLEKI